MPWRIVEPHDFENSSNPYFEDEYMPWSKVANLAKGRRMPERPCYFMCPYCGMIELDNAKDWKLHMEIHKIMNRISERKNDGN
jgi:hypothetical protein